MRTANLFFSTSSLIAASTLLGCTTMGQGSGFIPASKSHDQAVAFNWKSKNGGQSGTLSATLPNRKVFSGPFFQITSQTEVDDIEPLWNGWDYGWFGWNYWDPRHEIGFITRYSGKVVANLVSSSGDHMRCRFHLGHPYQGMSGGGDGECQLQNQEQLNAYFPAQ